MKFTSFRDSISNTPVLGPALVGAYNAIRRTTHPGSARFWERHYADKGTSGEGSQGVLAAFKAEVLNQFVAHHNITSVIEFGCGDGRQLALAQYPRYIGLDVSKTAIRLCRARFINDDSKSFFLYDSEAFVDRAGLFRADLAVSLDVIFHLIEDRVFEAYMHHLFDAGNRFVVLYTSDSGNLRYREPRPVNVRHRPVLRYVSEHLREWSLIERVPNRYPYQGDINVGSFADFYIYGRD